MSSDRVAWLVWTAANGVPFPQIWYEEGGRFVGSTDLVVLGRHKLAPGRLACQWDPEVEHCTCGALVLTKAYRFANGNIAAFDQYGKQMPYYQDAWARDPDAAGRIRRDWPAVEIKPGEMVR